jgi:hypothetical protein
VVLPEPARNERGRSTVTPGSEARVTAADACVPGM